MSHLSPLSLQAIEQRLIEQHPDINWQVAGDGYSYQVTGVGEAFAGLNKLKRQQLVYAVLNDAISDGRLHALTIHTFTPQEIEQKNNG